MGGKHIQPNKQHAVWGGEGEGKPGLMQMRNVLVEMLSQNIPKNVAYEIMWEVVGDTLAAKNKWKTSVFMHTPRGASAVRIVFDPILYHSGPTDFMQFAALGQTFLEMTKHMLWVREVCLQT